MFCYEDESKFVKNFCREKVSVAESTLEFKFMKHIGANKNKWETF